ncbi:pseudoazurin [Devosia nitrariae]|uniref:Pseudoazurin n=1 Tax=Devosia nitrariae TaxID=2071872 RepID=A0ABQ5W7U8_9HYPH|nr:pseudoazurin [Devosia nitrariae]GLQ56113.1 pseudoazurin [Devosia nitrariae]
MTINRRHAVLGTMALAATPAILSATPARAAEVEVQMLNQGEMGAMVFEPALIRIAAGDTVTFVPTDRGHNAETIRGMVPEGAEGFKGAINQPISVTLDVPGIYGVKCLPHHAMGMVALIVVGDDTSNVEEAKAARQPAKAKERFDALFAEIEAT